MIRATAAEAAPWYIIPADHKWFSRLLISKIFVQILKKLPLKYPSLNADEKAALISCRSQLVEGGNQSSPSTVKK